ncbi:MAG: TlpA disulfide reductase family protein [Candidatus Acidiferrum sp.]
MHKAVIPLAGAALCWMNLSPVCAQSPAQSAPQTTPKTTSQPGAAGQGQQQKTNADSTTTNLSLAEMARLARSKRPADAAPAAKSSRVFDDDNMPRGAYADGNAADAPAEPGAQAAGSSGSAASNSPFPEYRGKVVLLDFWASWCGPCRSALPNLKRLQAIYGGGDFVVVSISEDDDQSAWQAFVNGHAMNWPQRLDSSGGYQNQFGVRGLPTYVLLGRDGTVVKKYVGEELAESIVERVGPDLQNALSAKP